MQAKQPGASGNNVSDSLAKICRKKSSTQLITLKCRQNAVRGPSQGKKWRKFAKHDRGRKRMSELLKNELLA